MADTLVVNEIFLSIQGESTFAGLPCVFIRLTGCGLRCSYCDTAYAFAEGKRMPLAAICAQVDAFAARFADRPGGGIRLPVVELTGGEPLLQPNSLPLMQRLCEAGYTVLLETSGAYDISPVHPGVRRIMDLKCPGSGEVERNRWENLSHLRPTDEVKFVIATVEDYDWARRVVEEHQVAARCAVLFSWAEPLSPTQHDPKLKPQPVGQTPITRRELAERMLKDAVPARLQVQLHKIIWPPDARGV